MRCFMVTQAKRNPPNHFFTHIKYEHLLAGISGGVTSTLVLHPLDLLKIRFAVNDGQLLTRPNYHGLGNAVSTIIKEEGIRGLYRGVTPNCWGAGASWGFYFLFYNAIKTWMLDGNTKKTLSAGSHMLAAAEAGVITLFITNPIWVVKTRMCLQYSTTVGLPPSKHYTGMLDALVKVYRHEGIPGMYKGLVPGMFGVSHGALQFMAYEEMKKKYISYYQLPVDDKLGTNQYLSFAALSKLFAASVTYPYQVIRARLQDQYKEYSGVLEVIKKTWRYESLKGYYKGLVPNLLKVTPATAVTFVVYENVAKVLLKGKDSLKT
ncbi:LOW QUALITY PROTEIN: mitochondrial folate transporter/carrier-like [Stegodyphus dumicola]|uniref:LOW QUALITY PROTEIN: mitochondrial folate transporter/carrier-like n=1 Tax=Stegodyphus dumicola TaxID=202533 RepID=UPI0015A9D3B2|nr:LOW QUALITY PROTEIN: mitochondrial folate transporter/carrier-like [Stegodyphus dumicola]